jgi:hypothetical protein
MIVSSIETLRATVSQVLSVNIVELSLMYVVANLIFALS